MGDGLSECGEMNMYIYRCEDTLEGVFTAIYRVYEEHRRRDEVRLALEDEAWLFSTVIEVEPDAGKAEKVIRTLKKRFGDKNYEYLCLALAMPDAEKAHAVYRTVAAGLDGGYGFGQLFDNLADGYVHKTFRLATNAGTESGHFRQFVRFAELESGILYSKIEPRSNLLAFLMPHFADRFPEENFILHDVGRDWFGVHPVGAPWFLLRGEQLLKERPGAESFMGETPALSAEESKYQMLFKQLCKSITIEERHNGKLQTGMLPLRFREYMTEFQ